MYIVSQIYANDMQQLNTKFKFTELQLIGLWVMVLNPTMENGSLVDQNFSKNCLS